MSFGGVGGGQVRYALIVDDQATQKLNLFKNSLAQVQTQTSNLARNNTILNGTFSAGVKAITSSGPPLNNLINQQKTIGSQLKTLGSAFKNNALAIGAAASSVLGLYQNYANLSSAQNNANKASTAATAAANKVEDITRKLAATVKKYGVNSKEAAAVQADLAIAQERSTNKAESAKIAQDNLNQTMADFGINILPNVLLAGGSIVSIFDGLNLKGKNLTGVLSKLGNTFNGLAGSITGAGGGIKGLIANLGLLGLAIVGADAVLNDFNATSKILQDVTSGAIKPIEGLNRQLDNMSKLDFSSIEGAVGTVARSFTGELGIANILKNVEKGMVGVKKSTQEVVKPSKELQAAQEKLNIALKDPALKSHVTATANAAKATLAHAQAEVDRLKAVENTTAAIKPLGTSIKIVADNTTAAIKSTATIGNLWKVWEVEGGKAATVLDGFGDTIENLRKKFLALSAAQKDLFGTKFTQNVMQFTDLLKNWGGGKVTQTVAQTNQKLKDQANLVSLVNTTGKDLNKTWEVDAGKIAAQNTAKALEEARKKAEEFKKSLQAAQTDIKGVFKIDSNADKILKDLIKSLPNKAQKEIKLQVNFGQSVDDNKKAFNDMLFEATQVSDSTADASANSIIERIDKKFKGTKGQFAGLRAALEAAIADPNTPEKLKELLMNFNWDSIGVKINKDIQTGVNKTPLTVEVKATLAGFLNSGKSRFSGTAGGNSILASLGFKPEDLKITIPAPTIPKPVTTDFDAGVKTATTSVTNIGKTVPKITVNNKQAISLIEQAQKLWTNTQKIVPKLTVNNKQAISLIQQVQKLWTNTSKIVPKLTVNNSSALNQVKAIQSAINNIKGKTVNINVSASGSGLRFAQKGMHETLAQDTLIQAHKGERVDIGHGGAGEVNPSFRGSSGGGGTGGGNDTFWFNLHFGDKEIVKKVKRELGRQVYTLGA